MDFKFIFSVFVLQIVLTRSLSAAATQPQLENFTAAVKKISTDLYKRYVEYILENVVISPYSAVNALVLLLQAGNGNAFDQLKSSINFTGSESDLLDQYVAYQQSLTESAEQSTVIVANKLYVQKGYQVNSKFQEVATQKLLSGIEMVDFKNSTETAKIINDFAAKKTNNKTGDIAKPESWNAETRIILMNTIYMKFSFDKIHQAIAVNDTDNVEFVTFDNGWFNYAELNDTNAQALEIRFSDSDFSLLLILPNRDNNLSNLEGKMRDFNLTQLIDQMRPERVTVKIPTLQMKYQTSLKNIADKIQISNLFEMNKANLSGLLNNDTRTFISDAILTTVLELETGNKLDEKTNKFLSSLSKLYSSGRKQSFEATRPFLYYIWDRKLKTEVLSGHVRKFEENKRKQVSVKGNGQANASML